MSLILLTLALRAISSAFALYNNYFAFVQNGETVVAVDDTLWFSMYSYAGNAVLYTWNTVGVKEFVKSFLMFVADSIMVRFYFFHCVNYD
jgi:hypothetical protein